VTNSGSVTASGTKLPDFNVSGRPPYDPKNVESITVNNQLDAGVSYPQERWFRERFRSISAGYKDPNELMKSLQFQQLAKDIRSEFTRLKQEDAEKNAKVLDYMFNGMIPYMVMDEWVKTDKTDEVEAEFILQAIKRVNYLTHEEKLRMADKYLAYVENAFYANFKVPVGVDMKKDEDFRKFFLDPHDGAFYRNFSIRQDISKTGVGFRPDESEYEIMNYVHDKFRTVVLRKSGVTEAEFQSRTKKIMGFETQEQLAELVRKDFDALRKKYKVDGVIPLEHKWRNDEMDDAYQTDDKRDAILTKMANGKDLGEMKKDIEAYRLKTYLLAYFGKDDQTDYGQGKMLGVCQACGMWSTQRRMRYLSPEI